MRLLRVSAPHISPATPQVTAVVMHPAIHHPGGDGRQSGAHTNIQHVRHQRPVTAPLGRGMATSSTSPSVRYFRTFRPFKCARRSR